MIVVPDEGAIDLLAKTLRTALAADEVLSLRLYRNDYTPVAGSVLSSFVEATFWGYFRTDLDRASWSVPVIESGRAVSTWEGSPGVEWTAMDGPQTVYGYYVVSPLTGKVQWAERFNVAREMNTGAKLLITPKFTGRGEV